MRNRSHRAAPLAVAIMLALSATTQAQDNPQSTEPRELDKVIVTGSSIPRTDTETAAPEIDLSAAVREQLQALGIYARALRPDERESQRRRMGLFTTIPERERPRESDYEVAEARVPDAPTGNAAIAQRGQHRVHAAVHVEVEQHGVAVVDQDGQRRQVSERRRRCQHDRGTAGDRAQPILAGPVERRRQVGAGRRELSPVPDDRVARREERGERLPQPGQSLRGHPVRGNRKRNRLRDLLGSRGQGPDRHLQLLCHVLRHS